MNTYLVTVIAKLFMISRIVHADSKAAAASQVSQEGARLVWIVENPEIDD